MKISVGIYDHPQKYTVKVVRTKIRPSGKLYADMHFTNNPNYGKSEFGMEGKHLQDFLKGYTKRK